MANNKREEEGRYCIYVYIIISLFRYMAKYYVLSSSRKNWKIIKN